MVFFVFRNINILTGLWYYVNVYACISMIHGFVFLEALGYFEFYNVSIGDKQRA